MAHERNPYDISLTYSSTTKQFVLDKDETGAVAFRPVFLPELAQQQRTDAFSYEHRSPIVDLPASFERFHYGAGFEDAADVGELGFPGYNFTQGVDLSWGTRGYIAPGKQTGGSVTEAPIQFVRSELGLFAVTARYIYEWTGSAWTQRRDNTSNTHTHMIELKNSKGTYLLLGQANGPYLYSEDGIAWNEIVATGAVPAHRNTQTASDAGGSATSVTVTQPTSTAEDDILIACIATDGGSSFFTPSGWSLIVSSVGDAASDTAGLAMFWRRATASEAANYTFTISPGNRISAAVSAYSGVRTTGAPYESSGSAAVTATTAFASASIAASGANRMVVAAFAAGDAVTFTAGGGATERADINVANGPSLEVQEKEVDSASFQASATASGASDGVGISAALVPAAGDWNVSRWAVRGAATGEPVVWLIDVNGDIRSAIDPTDSTSWSAADATQFGQHGVTMAGVEVIDNVFYLVHDGGITSYNGTTVETTWDVKTLKLASNQARTAIGPDNRLYFAFSGSLMRLDTADLTVEKIWPRGPQIGNDELNGTITAITFNEGNGYFALKNADGNTYIMKFEPESTVTIGDETVWPVHTWFYNGGSDCRTLLVVDAASDTFSSTNPQVVMGDGTTADYLLLPRSGLRPEDDGNVKFDTNGGTLTGSFINYRAQGFPKWLTRGDIEGSGLAATKTIVLKYQTPGGSATTIATATANGRTTATLTPVSVTTVREVVVLATSGATVSPVLKGTVLHAAPNAPRDRGWLLTIRLRNDQPTNHSGVRDLKSTKNTSSWLRAAVNELVTFVDPYGDSYQTKVVDIETVDFRYGHDNHVEEKIQLTLAQLTS